MNKSFWTGLSASLLVASCGSSSGDGDADPSSGAECNVPECWAEALDALQACVKSPVLKLGPVNASSGVIEGLSCMEGSQQVTLSSFSERLNGTVPNPSSLTFLISGSECATLSFGTGSISTPTTTRAYRSVTIERAGEDDTTLNLYEDGDYEVSCGARADYPIKASALESCPESLRFAAFQRNEEVTSVGVDLVDAAGRREALFVCE